MHDINDIPLEFIGNSTAMREVRERIRRLASSDDPVLLTGETGTGKLEAARAIHAISARKSAPFTVVSCVATSSEDFERAMRAALTQKGGTVLFDEIADVPYASQPQLLRALGDDPEAIRLIASTERPLRSDVAAGKFRADLYFRLNVLQIAMPPLRERGDDALLIANTFLRRYAQLQHRPALSLSSTTAECLLDYAWPGNVRELENCMRNAVTVAEGTEVRIEDLTEPVRRRAVTRAQREFTSIRDLERFHIRRVLSRTHGNKSQAARILGIDRKTLSRKIVRYQIAPE